MDIITIFIIAIVLSFDTFAVSVSTGISNINILLWQAVPIALVLAFFQALMPFLGWFAGKQIEELIKIYDHWIAFGLLLILGIKMIYESNIRKKNEKSFIQLKLSILLSMAIATSIDAFVVGISFAFTNINILLTSLIIGLVTYIVSMLGILFGKKIGYRFGNKMEIVGGIILIALGSKILIDHLSAG